MPSTAACPSRTSAVNIDRARLCVLVEPAVSRAWSRAWRTWASSWLTVESPADERARAVTSGSSSSLSAASGMPRDHPDPRQRRHVRACGRELQLARPDGEGRWREERMELLALHPDRDPCLLRCHLK